MFRFLRNLNTLIDREPVAYAYQGLADDPEFWSADDSAALATFFKGVTGQKLRARLNNLVVRSAIKACSEPVNGDYQRGIARGMYITFQSIEKDFPVAPPQVGNIDEVAEQEQAAFAVL